MTPAVYPNLYKVIFFETLIIFVEPAIKMITEIVHLQKEIFIVTKTLKVLIFHLLFQRYPGLNAVNPNEIKPNPLCLDNILKDFTVNNMKKMRLNGIWLFPWL